MVGFLYGAVVLQTTWMEATYYKIRHRDTETMKNNGSFVYCNIMGPIQEITIVQVRHDGNLLSKDRHGQL